MSTRNLLRIIEQVSYTFCRITTFYISVYVLFHEIYLDNFIPVLMLRVTSAHRAKQGIPITSYSPVVSVVGSTVASHMEERRRLDLTLRVSVSDVNVHYLLPVDFTFFFSSVSLPLRRIRQ